MHYYPCPSRHPPQHLFASLICCLDIFKNLRLLLNLALLAYSTLALFHNEVLLLLHDALEKLDTAFGQDHLRSLAVLIGRRIAAANDWWRF